MEDTHWVKPFSLELAKVPEDLILIVMEDTHWDADIARQCYPLNADIAES